MSVELKSKTVKGVFWAVVEQFGIIGVKFILGIVLARLLLPTDFGIIGMVTVFFDIASEIIQGGFGQAYIQKKNVTKKDEATVFYFNFIISIIIYILLYLLAPLIANFYEQPLLKVLTRVMGTVVIIDSFSMVKIASMMKEINFKIKTKISLVSSIASGIISVFLAINGFGVWALVFYSLANKLFIAIGLWIKSSSISIRDFSMESFKTMFSIGSWLLISSLLKRLFENINIIVIGKYFPVFQVGYYTKAKQFQKMASGQILQAISIVAFPVFSSMQNDKEKLVSGMKQFLKQSLLIVFPISCVLFVISRPFVILFLTSKWEGMILYLKLFSIIGAFFPINAINTQVLVAQGFSKANFKITLIKNILRIANVFIMFRFGVLHIIIGEVVISLISLIINSYYNRIKLDYGLLSQFRDTRTIILGGIIGAIGGSLLSLFIANLYLLFFGGITVTLSIFIISQYIINKEDLTIVFDYGKKILQKIKK